MTNLYNIYNAAIENANQNDILVTISYIEQYAENAMNIYLSEEQALAIMHAYRKWNALPIEKRSQDEAWRLVQSPLSEIEINDK